MLQQTSSYYKLIVKKKMFSAFVFTKADKKQQKTLNAHQKHQKLFPSDGFLPYGGKKSIGVVQMRPQPQIGFATELLSMLHP